MSSKKNEKSNLLSIDTTESEYTETLIPPSIGCCNFVKDNKKPFIFILTLILLGAAATITILVLDHQGFWDKPEPVDQLWFKQTLTNTTNPRGLFPLWLRNANPIIYDNKNNTYHDNTSSLYLYKTQYGQLWNTDNNIGYNYSTLTTQCRLIYNFANAYKITNNISYKYAMKQGINVLLKRFKDTENGGFYYSINESYINKSEEIIIDSTKDSIGHAAVIHAISVAFIITDKSDLSTQSLYLNILNQTFDLFNKYFIDDYNGIYINLTKDFNPINGVNIKSQLPLMNYFEALSQLFRVSSMIHYVPSQNKILKMEIIEEAINDLYEFVTDLLYQYSPEYKILYEEYDVNWTYPTISSYASLGNAFKWSYLISFFIDYSVIIDNNNQDERQQAMDFFNYAMDLGYDDEMEKIHNLISPPSPSTNPPYWTVCNAIKTMYYLYNNYYQQNNDQLLQKLQNIITYYQDYYYDFSYGGIYYLKPNNLWKGNISKVDYECIDMSLFVADLSV